MARRIGLKDLTIAVISKNDATNYTTEAPQKLMKALKGKISVKKSSEKIYSDDTVEDILSALDSIDVEIEGDEITLAVKSVISTSKYVKGMLIEKEDDQAVEIALGFRAKDSKGKYQFVWLYCGKFDGDDEEEYETKGDKLAPGSKSLKGTFYARQKDGVFRVRVNESELIAADTDAKALIQAWFSEVPEPLEEGAEATVAEQIKEKSKDIKRLLDKK